MSYGQYVYTDNAGTDWQVSVPDDMATALGMVAATTQPYLDTTIAPRFANFRSATGLVRQGVIPTIAQFATIIGAAITLGGTPFVGSSAQGESTGALQPPLIQPPQAIMGPPGPAGPSGILGFYIQVLSSDIALPTPGQTDILNFGIVPAGTYLGSVTGVFENDDATEDRVQMNMYDSSEGQAIAIGEFMVPNTADDIWASTLSFGFTIDSSRNILCNAYNYNTAGMTAKGPTYGYPGTQGWLLQIG